MSSIQTFRLNGKYYLSNPGTEPALQTYLACSRKLSLTQTSGALGFALSAIGYLSSCLGPCATLVSCCSAGVCLSDPLMFRAEMDGIVEFMAEEVRRGAVQESASDETNRNAIDLGTVVSTASTPADIDTDSKKNR